MNDALTLTAVSRVYGKGGNAVAALREVSVGLPAGGFTAVMGPSGSGKSTFLHCAAGLDRPTAGSVRLGGTELTTLSETRLTELRRDRIGFVFQAFNLVPSLTLRQNVTLPLRLAGVRPDYPWLERILALLGLEDRLDHRPSELSGGQQQRAAIARALATRPRLLVGDEPTGALDTMTAKDVLSLMRQAVDELGQTVLMVTHDPVAASYADTVLFLADGRLVDALDRPSPAAVADRMTTLGAWS